MVSTALVYRFTQLLRVQCHATITSIVHSWTFSDHQVAFDDKVKVAYLIGNTELYVLDVSSDAMDVYASSPKVLPVLLTKDLPTPVTDVYFCGDLLAVSAEGATKVQPGQVLIFTRYQRSGTPGVNPVDSLKLLANFTVGELYWMMAAS